MLKIRQAVSFWLWCLPSQQNALLTLCLPHRPQAAVAVWTDCAMLAPSSLAPGMVTKDRGLEGFGQRLGTGVLKEFDFIYLTQGLDFQKSFASGFWCLEMQMFPLGAYTGIDRGRPMESCSPWRDLCPEGTLPKQQSQPGWQTHMNDAVCPAGGASFGHHSEMPEVVRKKQNTQNTFGVEDPPWVKVTGLLLLIWWKVRLLPMKSHYWKLWTNLWMKPNMFAATG